VVKLLCTDFDGTIHDPADQPPMAPELLDSLRAAQRSGILWVLSTGRILPDILTRLQPLTGGVWPDYIVAVEREIHERHNGGYRGHSAWNAHCQAAHAVLFSQAHERLNAVRSWIEENFDARLYTDEWSPFSIVAQKPEDAERIHERIMGVCREVPNLCVMRNTLYFRFAHRRYTKGTALGEIARHRGLKKESILAVGDHFNDLEMLDGVHAGCVATLSNAIPEIKQAVTRAGGYIARQPASRGVVEALRFFSGEK
jgi:HAD superfamily hydrolase (TIGR01484 family)